jgi:hypothetical protein
MVVVETRQAHAELQLCRVSCLSFEKASNDRKEAGISQLVLMFPVQLECRENQVLGEVLLLGRDLKRAVLVFELKLACFESQ